MAFEVDVELSDAVVQEIEQRIRDPRKRLDEPNESVAEKTRVTERLLRYQVDLEIQSRSGVMRGMNERLAALRQRGGGEKARKPFLEKNGSKLSLRMEGQGHPTMHELGLDYIIASSPLDVPTTRTGRRSARRCPGVVATILSPASSCARPRPSRTSAQ